MKGGSTYIPQVAKDEEKMALRPAGDEEGGEVGEKKRGKEGGG